MNSVESLKKYRIYVQFLKFFVQCGDLQSYGVFAIICGFIMSIFQSKGCNGDCGHCEFRKEGETHSHTMPTEQCPGGLESWKLSGSAALVFLFPMLTALLGAVISGDSANRQLIGGIAGAAAGLLVAVLVVKLIFRKKNSQENKLK